MVMNAHAAARVRLPRLLGFAALSANLHSFAEIRFQPKP
jgi:hypothetical protein